MAVQACSVQELGGIIYDCGGGHRLVEDSEPEHDMHGLPLLPDRHSPHIPQHVPCDPPEPLRLAHRSYTCIANQDDLTYS